MSWLLNELTRHYADDDTLTVPHIDEHDGRVYETPSIINTDTRKENDGEET